MTNKQALRLERISGEFTMLINRDEARHFVENYQEIMYRLEVERTSKEVLAAYKAKYDLALAYLSVEKALSNLKEE